MPEFISPLSGLTKNIKLTDEELSTAKRLAAKAESEDVQIHLHNAESIANKLAADVLKSDADEEDYTWESF